MKLSELKLKAFGHRIKLKRVDYGLNLRDMAKKIGIATATLNRVESGLMPKLHVYALICYGLNLPDKAQDLLDIKEKPKKKAVPKKKTKKEVA